MMLGTLIPEAAKDLAAIRILGVTADSRLVKPGFLFVAVTGVKADGRHFAEDAARRGAAAILMEGEGPSTILSTPVLRATDSRAALAAIAARYHPRQPDCIVAVTGTSGKTSVAEFTRQIFQASGRSAASLGTIGLITAQSADYGALTTPDPVSLHRTLDELAGAGITHLAMEASSHGLDQKRLDAVRLAAVGFTNLRRDHLDYHPSLEAYCAAKLRLFENLAPEGAGAVVNADGEFAERFIATAKARRLRLFTTGVAGHDLRLVSARRADFAQALEIADRKRTYRLTLPLVGDYQASNALVAAGLAIACGIEASDALSYLERLKGVRGRLEIMGKAKGGIAVVDYAHKPDALEAALTALRPFATGRLICIFGCGGDRDKGKRPIMGAIASRLADIVIVTDDNPRSEEPAAIRAEIMAGAKGAREIGDRSEAIRTGMRMLDKGDVLIVAGKGHETGQIIGDRTFPFSDQDTVLAELSEYSR